MRSGEWQSQAMRLIEAMHPGVELDFEWLDYNKWLEYNGRVSWLAGPQEVVRVHWAGGQVAHPRHEQA